MASTFKPDPLAAALASGDRPSSWGLNLNLASPPPPELAAPYERLTAALSTAFAPAGNVHLYPFSSLHITASSPAPFTHCGLDASERASYVAKWAAALRDACTADNGFPTGPFPVVYERVVLESAAAFFAITDPTGSVARVRACIKRAAELVESESVPTPRAVAADGDDATPTPTTAAPTAGTPADAASAVTAAASGGAAASSVGAASAAADDAAAAAALAPATPVPQLCARAGFKTPGIVHSTFLRFTTAAPGLPDAEVRERFEAAAAAEWSPVTVTLDRLLLVIEAVPYMHLDLRGRDADKIVAEFAFV